MITTTSDFFDHSFFFPLLVFRLLCKVKHTDLHEEALICHLIKNFNNLKVTSHTVFYPIGHATHKCHAFKVTPHLDTGK